MFEMRKFYKRMLQEYISKNFIKIYKASQKYSIKKRPIKIERFY